MKGLKILLRSGEVVYFPEAEHWNDKGDKLDLKESRHGNRLARFSWRNIVCVYDADDVRIERGNNNL